LQKRIAEQKRVFTVIKTEAHFVKAADLCEVDRMKTPRELDSFVNAVLSYKPKPKTKAAKRRQRRDKRKAKKSNG
jgi:hypothetical protein